MIATNILQKEIDFRFTIITEHYEAITDADEGNELKIKSFLQQIAFFFHALLKYPETKFYIDKVINYRTNLQNEGKFRKHCEDYWSSIIAAVKALEAESKYPDLLIECQNRAGDWRNPFKKYEMIGTKELFSAVPNQKDTTTDYNVFIDLFEVIIRVHQIGLSASLLSNPQAIYQSRINEISTILAEIELLYDFESDFQFVRSFAGIYEIYLALFPVKQPGQDVLSSLNAYYYQKGKVGRLRHSIYMDAKKVLHQIKFALTASADRDYFVESFVAYSELYLLEQLHGAKSTKKEKFCQQKFEEFAFLHGFYPISEAAFATGRLDTLLLTESRRILFEIKQIGEKDNTKKKIADKLRDGMGQAHAYAKKIKNIGHLADEVFVLVFSEVPFTLDAFATEIYGKKHLFKIINICPLPISKQSFEHIKLTEIIP